MLKLSSFSKIVFDFIMLILLVAVYCAQPTGIPAHEYIGIGIYIFFIIHLAYNYKWIISTAKSLFDKTVNIRVKFIYIIDFLLLIAFIIIGLSGVLISHVIFKFGIMPVWRPLHSIVSAISIILLSIHIGLHGNMIIDTVKTKIKLHIMVKKILAIIIFIIILCIGIYGDVISKIKPSQNNITKRPKYETTLALFNRSINLLSGPPEYVRNRMTEGSNPRNSENKNNNAEMRGGGGKERQGAPQNKFNINVLIISITNYLAFILLCSIIVFIIDKKINRKDRQPSMAGAS